jgi:hypothetical protein
MQVRIAREAEFVNVALSGPVDLHALLELIRKLGKATQSQGDVRMVFDCLQLEGDMHFAGQMQIGEQVAHCLPHMIKVASIMPVAKITRTSEKTAQAQGVALRIFESRGDAIFWLLDDSPDPSPAATRETLDPTRGAIWGALKHLFPGHAQAIQLPNGTLAISWSIANQPDAVYEMATPITIRLEPALEEHMRTATSEQRKRIAAHQETAFRQGLVGYDPFTSVPRARVIVLG